MPSFTIGSRVYNCKASHVPRQPVEVLEVTLPFYQIYVHIHVCVCGPLGICLQVDKEISSLFFTFFFGLE